MAKNAKMKYAIQTKYVAGIPRYNYVTKNAKPDCIVMHDTGNDSSKIDGEIAYMSNNYNSAFVHAWIDADKIVETANTDFICWGAGPNINGYAIQGELVHEHTKERFLKSLDRWIFYFAYQLYWYDIKPDDATNDGYGTVFTHEAVSKFRGGTDHVDPMPYIKERSKKLVGRVIEWKEIYAKLVEYHNALESGDSTKVSMIGSEKLVKMVVKKEAVKPVKKETKPKATAKPVVKTKPNTYTVKHGDSLWAIGQQFKLNWKDIYKWNHLNTEVVYSGQVLLLEPVEIKKATVVKKQKKPVKSSSSKPLNPIEYLVKKGFNISSDPNTYSSGVWGLRNYTASGYNYDSYCSGYHRAYDLYGATGVGIPAVFDGEVVTGTDSHGNFGGTVVVANEKLGLQVIYGHLRRNLKVKVGDKVKQGQIIGFQGNTNYYNVPMNEHLHIQFQNYKYYENEVAFVCSGIDIKNIDVTKYPAVNLK